MEILSEFQVQKEIREVMEMNKEQISLTIGQEAEASEIFFNLMKEKVNSKKDIEMQKSMVSDIVIGLSRGEKSKDFERRYGDNRHLEYFNTVLEEGAAGQIIEALRNNNLPTDILKGVRRDTPYNEFVKGYKGVRVIQEIEKVEGTSPFVSYFAIEKDGNIIYEWKPSERYVHIYDIEDDEIPYEEMQENKVRVPKQKETDGQKTVKRVTENTSSTTRRIDFYYTKKGNLCRRIIENGKFVGGGLVK